MRIRADLFIQFSWEFELTFTAKMNFMYVLGITYKSHDNNSSVCQGEYVAPEKIENVYRASPYIAQCFVDGNSLKVTAFCLFFAQILNMETCVHVSRI